VRAHLSGRAVRRSGQRGTSASSQVSSFKDRDGEFRALWAAYQHYGDPTERLKRVDAPDGGTSTRSRTASRRGRRRARKR